MNKNLAIDSLGQNKAGDDKVLPRRGVKEMGRKDQERIEPAAGLVDSLRYEIRGERSLEFVLILKRVVGLRIRHTGEIKTRASDLVKRKRPVR